MNDSIVESVKPGIESRTEIHDESRGSFCEKVPNLFIQYGGAHHHHPAMKRLALEFAPVVGNEVVKAFSHFIAECTRFFAALPDAVIQRNEQYLRNALQCVRVEFFQSKYLVDLQD